jgi:hypothetical protein
MDGPLAYSNRRPAVEGIDQNQCNIEAARHHCAAAWQRESGPMNLDTLSSIVAGAVLVAILVTGFSVYWLRRRRTKRLLILELLKEYFQGGMPSDQLDKRIREIAGRHFTRDAELYSLVIAAFQRAVEAKLVHQAHSKEDEIKLLSSLATLKKEFGLPDRYQIEAWRPGRE